MIEGLIEEYIEAGDAESLRTCLERDPSAASQKTSHNVSALMLCCYFRRPDLAAIVHAHLRSINIFEAAAIGRSDLVERELANSPELIEDFSEDGFTALSLASYFGHEDVARLLILKGADPNIPSQNGFDVYPIHSAVAANQTMLAKMLMEAGADVNVSQKSGVTPLHSAAHNGNIELLIVLLEAGANVHAKTEDGKTPADKALEKGYLEIAKILS